jgi:hypothetical protein
VPGTTDVFIAKFDPTGRNLLWTTFLGGNDSDTPSGVATDEGGNIYVAGTTQSTNFPGTAFSNGCTGSTAFQQTCPSSISLPPNFSGGSFIAKLTPVGIR